MDKIRIYSPSNGFRESQYVWKYLIEEVLGWEVDVLASKDQERHILQVGNRNLSFANTFFTSDDLASLIVEDRIPEKVERVDIFLAGSVFNVAPIYGEAKLENNGADIHCEFDIVASSFFMLSRWEERHIEKDEHDRPIGAASLLGRNALLQVPVVNEYIDLLVALLRECGWTKARRQKEYNVCPTHDIDHLYLTNSPADFARKIAFSMVKKPSFLDTVYKVASVLGKDVYDRYSEFMDEAEAINTKAVFYFLMSDATDYDYKRLPAQEDFKKVVKQIQDRGHQVGIHPSYDTSDLEEEMSMLRTSGVSNIIKSRQHYLRYREALINEWERCGIQQDSTLGYADLSGFRCGICYDFPMYHLEERRVSKVWQRPLLIMDVTVRRMSGRLENKMKSIQRIASEVKKHNGNFTFLWHNSSLDIDGWKIYEPIYKLCYAA